MRIKSNPPRSTSTVIIPAPASIEFSTNSLTTCAGLSTTSPAAIWPIVFSSSWIILLGSVISLPPIFSVTHTMLREHLSDSLNRGQY